MYKKKKNQNDSSLISREETSVVQTKYLEELEKDPEYSIEVDPLNKYSMPSQYKEFIKAYINFKSIYTAAELAKIEPEEAKAIFNSYSTQMEIRRINRALYQRQFASKMLTLDQLGGYLSSLITDNFVPVASQLKSKEKLKAIELMLKIGDLKNQAINNPSDIIERDMDSQLKDLSIDAIQKLIEQTSDNKEEKKNLVEQIDSDQVLTMEEKSYLETLSVEELLKILNNNESKGGSDE